MMYPAKLSAASSACPNSGTLKISNIACPTSWVVSKKNCPNPRKAGERRDRAHRRYPDRARIGRARFPRERALRSDLSPSLSGRRKAVSRRERGAADELAVAVEDRDFERDLGVREHARRPLPCSFLAL